MIAKLSFFLLALALLLAPSVASAHTLKINGSIGGIMHVDPDDTPIANQVSDFFVEITDRQNKFTPLNCSCQAYFYQGNTNLGSVPITFNGADATGYFSFTFPGINVYVLKIEGVPTTPGAFQAFTLTYTIRVAQTTGGQPSFLTNLVTGHAFHLLLIGGGVVAFFAVVLVDRYHQQQT